MKKLNPPAVLWRWLLIVLVLAAVSLLSIPAARAALSQAPALQDSSAFVNVTLSPAALSGDFYVNDVLAASGLNNAQLTVPSGVEVRVEARNVRDASPDFGTLYTYENASVVVTLAAGQTRTQTLYPRKVYIKGVVELTCDLRDVRTGEQALCRPTLDGVPQPDMAPTQKARLLLTPGAHTIKMDVVGTNASLWYPASNTHNVSVSVGSTYYVRSTFSRKGLLTVNFNQRGVFGDIYIDDVLVGTQVQAAQLLVAPGTHRVQARNFTDPASGGIYRWKDTVVYSVYLTPGQQRTSTLWLQKEYLVGFVSVLCSISGAQAGDDVQCNANIDGGTATVIPAGARRVLNALPGSHTLNVTLIGASASRWEASKSQTVSVRAGSTTYATVTFAQVTSAPAPGTPPPGGTPAYTGHISNVGPHLETIFARGQAMGKLPNSFTKVGDCEMEFNWFLYDFDRGIYDLGKYQYLAPVLSQFRGSFGHKGQVANSGMSSSAIFEEFWALSTCNDGETPLSCEYRQHRPSISLIMLRTIDHNSVAGGKFYGEVMRSVDDSISAGVIPVLQTIPYWGTQNPNTESINAVIRRVAAEKNVPLWDYALTSDQLPDRGVTVDYHIQHPADGSGATLLTDARMQDAATRRNLEALEVLHAILTQVIQN
jgi:hypothetical protein